MGDAEQKLRLFLLLKWRLLRRGHQISHSSVFAIGITNKKIRYCGVGTQTSEEGMLLTW